MAKPRSIGKRPFEASRAARRLRVKDMAAMAAADCAVIFDVDGVLLDLTRAEEDAFFLPFERRYGLNGHEVCTLDRLAVVLGLTRERVRQIQVEALRSLRSIIKRRGVSKDALL